MIFSNLSWLNDLGPMTIGKVAVGELFPLFFRKIMMVKTQMLPDFEALFDFDVSKSSFHSTNESGKWRAPVLPCDIYEDCCIDCHITSAICTSHGVLFAYWYVPFNAP